MSEKSIINNLTGNHYQRIMEIAKNADTLYIVSPFLMKSFSKFFGEIKKTGITNIHLVTTLKDNDENLVNKAKTLRSLSRLCKKHNVQLYVYRDNKLHGKIYVASKDSVYINGILTSANFTESGLKHNHEWGVQIDDSGILETLMEEVFKVCDEGGKPLSDESIDNFIKYMNVRLDSNPELGKSKKVDLPVNHLIEYQTTATDFDMRGLNHEVVKIVVILAHRCCTEPTEPRITYKELSTNLEKEFRVLIAPNELDVRLYQLGIFCIENKLPKLPVIVVQSPSTRVIQGKKEDTPMPGAKFFNEHFYPKDKIKTAEDRFMTFVEELKCVIECTQWDRLIKSAKRQLSKVK